MKAVVFVLKKSLLLDLSPWFILFLFIFDICGALWIFHLSMKLFLIKNVRM